MRKRQKVESSSFGLKLSLSKVGIGDKKGAEERVCVAVSPPAMKQKGM